MKRVLSPIVILLALCLAAAPALADKKSKAAKDNAANRLKAAAKYYEAAEYHKMLKDSLMNLSAQIPKADQPAFVGAATKFLAGDNVKKQITMAAARRFTLSELNALVDFYNSDIGKSILYKMPDFNGKITDIMRKEIGKLIMESQAAPKKEPPKEGKHLEPPKKSKPAKPKAQKTPGGEPGT